MSNSIIDHQRDQDLFNPFIIYKPKPMTEEIRQKLREQLELLGPSAWIITSMDDFNNTEFIPL
jgi:hypothetical protein